MGMRLYCSDYGLILQNVIKTVIQNNDWILIYGLDRESKIKMVVNEKCSVFITVYGAQKIK